MNTCLHCPAEIEPGAVVCEAHVTALDMNVLTYPCACRGVMGMGMGREERHGSLRVYLCLACGATSVARAAV